VQDHPGSGVTSHRSVPLVTGAWVKARVEEGVQLIVVRKWVVDVTQFKEEHPGGDVFSIGEDLTMAFYNEHGCAPGILDKLATLTVCALPVRTTKLVLVPQLLLTNINEILRRRLLNWLGRGCWRPRMRTRLLCVVTLCTTRLRCSGGGFCSTSTRRRHWRRKRRR
jgi:hypothetical protein